MKKIIFLAMLCMNMIYSEKIDLKELNQQYEGKILISQEDAQELYQVMKDIHEIFEMNDIEYWIQGGTLVGALRCGGLIWWDDDLDINIRYYDVGKLFELEPIFNSRGLTIQRDPMIKIIGPRGLGADIFGTIHEGNKTRYLYHWWRRESEPVFLYDEELYPLVKYQFGPIQVWGPQSPHQYLKWGFGENYINEVHLYNHIMQDAVVFSLSDIDVFYQQAVPLLHPLKDTCM